MYCRSDIKHNVDVHIPKTDNLTQTERSTLRDIQERDDIIIKPADKGSAVVVIPNRAPRVVFLVNFRQKIETAWLGILWSKVLHGLCGHEDA
jgi:hypothetical protein